MREKFNPDPTIPKQMLLPLIESEEDIDNSVNEETQPSIPQQTPFHERPAYLNYPRHTFVEKTAPAD
jgi:hypothetical protein